MKTCLASESDPVIIACQSNDRPSPAPITQPPIITTGTAWPSIELDDDGPVRNDKFRVGTRSAHHVSKPNCWPHISPKMVCAPECGDTQRHPTVFCHPSPPARPVTSALFPVVVHSNIASSCSSSSEETDWNGTQNGFNHPFPRTHLSSHCHTKCLTEGRTDRGALATL